MVLSSPDGFEHGDEAGHWVGNRRHGGSQMVGFVPIRQTGVRLNRGQHCVGQRVDPSQCDKDEQHLQIAVGALSKRAPGSLDGLQRADHGLLFWCLGVQRQALFSLVCRQVSAEVKVVLSLSGHGRVIVEQDEGCQADNHHDAEEDEEDLGREPSWLVDGLQQPVVNHGGVGVRRVDRAGRGAVLTVDHANALDQRHQRGYQAAQALAGKVRREVLRAQSHHERQEGDGGGAVNDGEQEGQQQQGHAARGAAHRDRVTPEERHQERRHHAQGDDAVDDRPLIQLPRAKAVHQGDEEGPHVSDLDEDDEVGREVPALRDVRHDQRKLHPHPIDRDPGADAEEARQHVSQQRHGGVTMRSGRQTNKEFPSTC